MLSEMRGIDLGTDFAEFLTGGSLLLQIYSEMSPKIQSAHLSVQKFQLYYIATNAHPEDASQVTLEPSTR